MEILNLIDTFSEFKEFKNIDREAMMHIIEDVFKAMLAKKYGSDEYFNIIVNIDKGVLEIYHNRTVVEDGNVEDPLSEIEYSEAIKIEPDFEVGEEVFLEFKTVFGDIAEKSTARKNKKYYIDTDALNVNSLLEAGILKENIDICPLCTFCNNDIFFYNCPCKNICEDFFNTLAGHLCNISNKIFLKHFALE
jgi:hypothetical protein